VKRRVLVLFPTRWDERQFEALPRAVRARTELLLDEPRDEDVRWDLDLGAYVTERARRWRGRIDGVLSSSDYPGAFAAAALAEALGLPGAPPASVLAASHKYLARCAQQALVPEAVPRFRLFDPGDEASWPPPDEFPCFVKPVKGSFSLFARELPDAGALRAFAAQPALAEFQRCHQALFAALLARYRADAPPARSFLAEEVLQGSQVTVEGWVQHGRAHVLGVVDSHFQPGTRSFARFELPSRQPAEVQARMGRIACELALQSGLDHTLFNVELIHDARTGRTGIVELNPRLAGQFCDLYQKVDGTSSFALALALACGEPVETRRGGGDFAAAASVPLRVRDSVRVRGAPGPAARRAAEGRAPGTLVWVECAPGAELVVGSDVEDGESVRYAVVNLGGRDRADVDARLAAVAGALGFVFEPLPPRALETTPRTAG
jgi:hypothetical protein